MCNRRSRKLAVRNPEGWAQALQEFTSRAWTSVRTSLGLSSFLTCKMTYWIIWPLRYFHCLYFYNSISSSVKSRAHLRLSTYFIYTLKRKGKKNKETTFRVSTGLWHVACNRTKRKPLSNFWNGFQTIWNHSLQPHFLSIAGTQGLTSTPSDQHKPR